MLMKDKDILSSKAGEEKKEEIPQKPKINKKNMKSAWGDAFDYYIRGITEKYLRFYGRATRLEFFGFVVANCVMFFVMYLLGVYINNSMIAYYYLGAVSIPSVGVLVRRFHDINKKALLFLILGVVFLLSSIFIGFGALVLILVWYVFVFKLLLNKSYEGDGLYGAPNDNDEIYDEDNELIIKKFFNLSLIFSIFIIVMTGLEFDNWKTQNDQKQTINIIKEDVVNMGLAKGLSQKEIDKALSDMISHLRKIEGQKISEQDLNKLIEKVVDEAKNSSNNQ